MTTDIEIDFRDRRSSHITKVQIANFVRTQRVGKAKFVSNQLPTLAGNQQIQQSQIAAQIILGANGRLVRFLAP